MRVLPKRPDHERGRAAQDGASTNRHRHRGVDGREPLPLRHLCPHSRGDQGGFAAARVGGGHRMSAATRAANEILLGRRSFLRVSATVAGGLIVSLHVDRPLHAQEAGQAAPASKAYPPDAFVQIRPDGKIVIKVNRLEFGQGVQTSLPMILADEMDADWSEVIAELAPAAEVYKDPLYGIQMVGGSGSIAHSFQQYRELGAKTRAMLVAAAADRWHVAPDQCRTEASVVHGPAGQSATYAELASEAARQTVPTNVRLKNPAEFR